MTLESEASTESVRETLVTESAWKVASGRFI